MPPLPFFFAVYAIAAAILPLADERHYAILPARRCRYGYAIDAITRHFVIIAIAMPPPRLPRHILYFQFTPL